MMLMIMKSDNKEDSVDKMIMTSLGKFSKQTTKILILILIIKRMIVMI